MKASSDTKRRVTEPTPLFFHISVNATRTNAASWGDTQYANGLGRALGRLNGGGWNIVFRGEVPKPTIAGDVMIRIVGPHLEEPVPGMTNLVWIISPPNLAPSPMLARFQKVLSASALHAMALTKAGCPAIYLRQVTDAAHFKPEKGTSGATESDVVFVGALAERAERRLVFDAIEAGFEPQIWGPGWKGAIPDRLWRGERVDHDKLADIYANARVVLNSHMPQMARLGFMSNRSYDALASGAFVVSDRVAGFAAPDLPELRQAGDKASLTTELNSILQMPPPSFGDRMNLHARIVANHTFDQAAQTIYALASNAVNRRLVSPPAYCVGRTRDLPPPRLTDPMTSGPDVQTAMRSAAAQIIGLTQYLEQPNVSPPKPAAPATEQGVVHALMADLREMQQIAISGDPKASHARIEAIASGARRVAEVLGTEHAPLGLDVNPKIGDGILTRIKANEPLWALSPEGFDRVSRKASVVLSPRRAPPSLQRSVGVFLHLYYIDLAKVFAERLAAIGVPIRLYVSTDTEQKADHLRAVLPDAEVRVVENRGRDILPKLYGFGDMYDAHDIVLHLHGKKSLHSTVLDEWLVHILDCLLGSAAEINRILSFFDAIPQLGIVMPVAFNKVLGAAHWGDNHDIARELAWRIGLSAPLPPNNDLRFPVGSMFWARTEALRPLLDLNLRSAQFPAESGQVDGTLAHAIERMIGVVCTARGYHLLPVSGIRTRCFTRFQTFFSSNGDLRRALAKGAGVVTL